jgi:hypothetical protein
MATGYLTVMTLKPSPLSTVYTKTGTMPIRARNSWKSRGGNTIPIDTREAPEMTQITSKSTPNDNKITKESLSTVVKVSGNRTNYTPLELNDESVYDMARHYYTLAQIAERFKVTGATILSYHGEAFNKGKDEAFNKPRMLLNKIFDDFSGEMNFSRTDVPTGNLLKAIELHARKYEGMGNKQEVEVTHRPVAPSDIKFEPLTPDNKDDAWK